MTIAWNSVLNLGKNLIVHFCLAFKPWNVHVKLSDYCYDYHCYLKLKRFFILLLQADPPSLKSFLSILKLGDKELQNVKLSCLTPAKASDIEKPKTDLKITRRSDYPLGKPFPSSLTKLSINNCALLRIEIRILQIRELLSLNLADNQIKEIPCKMARLSTLSELVLHGNRIKELPASLCNGAIASSLKVLDLSHNMIKLLPSNFCNFKNLIHLKLNCNQLHMLPANFGNLTKLRFLSASGNHLTVLPYSISKLKLESIDVSANPFLDQNSWSIVNKLALPSLKELAGMAIKRCRSEFAEKKNSFLSSCHEI